MPMQPHKLYLDRDRSEELSAEGLRRVRKAAKIRVVKFGIGESIRVLQNAGIEGKPIEVLKNYRDKLEAQAAEL
jgi:hypothetical protein